MAQRSILPFMTSKYLGSSTQALCAASALDHPNIVTIFDISEVEGLHFIVMQFVDGKTLRELIALADSASARSSTSQSRSPTD